MKSTAIATAMIALFVAIGMTGGAIAGTTTQTYVGDGTYSTSWNGNHGRMNVDTYTSNGQDHLVVDYKKGMTLGYQSGDTNTWSEIDRSVNTQGRKTSVSAVTLDNSGNLIAIDASAKRGGTYLDQAVYTADGVYGYDVDGVLSKHYVDAYGRKYRASVYTEAGDAYTVVDVLGKRSGAGIYGMAVAGSGYGYAATGQTFNAHVYAKGTADIIGSGDYVGDYAYVQNDGTGYSSYANGETYINLHDQCNYNYDANGYIYAVDIPNAP